MRASQSQEDVFLDDGDFDVPAKSVLVVDDDPQVRTAMLRSLSHLDVELVESVHADDALGLLARRAFDVVITDWKMPGGGGRRIIDALSVTAPRPRIIVVSAERFEVDDALWTGWDAVSTMLDKPFGVDRLVEEVERALA